mmetsp:Transcript_70200/g.176884  ORF Transcript_70200/g.176884 Transcript_70200/m.176884 type:complete len:237 (+) Transcript_70200:722-1432(+)
MKELTGSTCCYQGGWALGQHPFSCRLHVQSLIDHEVVWHTFVALGLAHVHHLELRIVECRKEHVALHILCDARDEDARASCHIHRLLVRRLAADHKGVLHVLLATQFLQSACNRRSDEDPLRERRDECRVILGCARQHDVHAPWQRPELGRDGLPSLAAHDHGVLLALLTRRGDALEVRHVARKMPWKRARTPDPALWCGSHNDRKRQRRRCRRHSLGDRGGKATQRVWGASTKRY